MNPISIRSTAELIATLPYHLGYHPTESVLVVCLTGTRLGMIARVDVPAAADLTVPDVAVDVEQGIADMVRVAAREATAAIVITFDDRAEVGIEMAGLVSRDLESAGVCVEDCILVQHGHWSRLDGGEDPVRDRAGPRPVPSAHEVGAVAEFVALGRSPVADRAALEALVAHHPGERSDAVLALLGRRCARASANRTGRLLPTHAQMRAWRTLLTIDPSADEAYELAPKDVAAVTFSLVERGWRDAVIAWMAPGTLPLNQLDDEVAALVRRLPEPTTELLGPRGLAHDQAVLRQRWLRMCQLIPDEAGVVAAATLTVAGQLMWCTGDGALARACLERALSIAPDYYLAKLLIRIVANGIRLNAA